jgi:serine/threonine protein kinase
VHADYRVLSSRRPLGEGHYGVVRECESRANTGEVLAVKSVNKSRIRRLDHLRREVRLLSKMNHPNVLTMVDVYEDAESVHIVTEKCEGRELFDVVGENTRGDGCLSEERAARVMRELLEAVGYLHANGIVHRDIKPENVLFASADEEESSSVKLIDFGLSRRHKRGEGPMTNPVGTAYYMAPELLNGEYDKSCDVWSLGTVAYIMLCGYPPFNGETDPDIFDAIRRGRYDFPAPAWSDKSEEAKDFVKCLLRMDPRKRFTAREALGHPWIRNDSQLPSSSPSMRMTTTLLVLAPRRPTTAMIESRAWKTSSQGSGR